MDDKTLEKFLTAINNYSNRTEEKIDRIGDFVEQIARTTAIVLEIVQTNDKERKEIKATIKELDRRVTRLERTTV
jgi:transposase